MSLQIGEERLSFMFLIELSACGFVESRHLRIVDLEACLSDAVENLAHVFVPIWLDHCKGATPINLKLLAGVNIAIVCDPEYTRQDGNLCALEEIIKTDGRDLNFLEENSV